MSKESKYEYTSIHDVVKFGNYYRPDIGHCTTIYDIVKEDPPYVKWMWRQHIISEETYDHAMDARRHWLNAGPSPSTGLDNTNQVSTRYEQPIAGAPNPKPTEKPPMKNQVEEMIKTATANVTDETKSNLKLQVGKQIFNLLEPMILSKVLGLGWFKRATMKKQTKDMLVLGSLYAATHLLRSKHDNYALEALTVYMNYKAQDSVVGSLMPMVKTNES